MVVRCILCGGASKRGYTCETCQCLASLETAYLLLYKHTKINDFLAAAKATRRKLDRRKRMKKAN